MQQAQKGTTDKQILIQRLIEINNSVQIKETIKQNIPKIQNTDFQQANTQAQDQSKNNTEELKVKIKLMQILQEKEKVSEGGQGEPEKVKNQLKNEQKQPQQQISPQKPRTELPPIVNSQANNRYKNDDFPISTNFDYWSTKHSKSIEVKEYMKNLHEKDRKIKESLRNKKLAVEQVKRKKAQTVLEEQLQEEIRKKQLLKNQALTKINMIKQQQQIRKGRQKQFQNFLKSYKQQQPLHAKLEHQYRQKAQKSFVEKRKLLAQPRIPTLQQIAEHARKFNEQLANRSRSPIIYSNPIRVSYKSKFHSSLEKQDDSINPKELTDRKNNYGKMVQEVFKPIISERLVEEIQERLLPKDPLSLKKRVKSKENEEEDDGSEYSENLKKEQNNIESDEYDDEDSSQDGKLEEVEQPHCAYLNKIGNQYLNYVKGLKKKTGPQTLQEKIKFAQQLEEQERQKHRQKVFRPNYLDDLKRMRAQNLSTKMPTINWEQDLHNPGLSALDKKKIIFKKSERIAEIAQKKDHQLDNMNMNLSDTLEERKKVDEQYVEAIRAKLALLKF